MTEQSHLKNTNHTVNFSLFDRNFHSLFSDIENMFILFLLSNKVLADHEVQKIFSKDDIFSHLLRRYNNWTKLKIKIENRKPITEMNVSGQMDFLGKSIILLAYELILASKYNTFLNNDDLIKFLKFIRNGTAHNNKFNLKDEFGNWKLGENEQIKWRYKTIDRSLHKSVVFPNFFKMVDVMILLKDISDKLETIDKTKKSVR